MKSVLMLGGDKRNLILFNLLKNDGYNVFSYGLEEKNNNLIECIFKSEIIVTAIPFSVDFENIYSPLSEKNINIDEFIDITNNKKVVTGNMQKKYYDILKLNNNVIFDIMSNEDFVINNTIPTAEGVLKLIIEYTDITVNSSNIAILGFGKTGKMIAKILKNVGANIFCKDIKKEEVANIKLSGYNVIDDIYRDLINMDVIINTIPAKVITKKEIDVINKKTLIIDIASKPGGIDFEYANKCNIQVIHALGLPGKIAPMTSAKYLKNVIEKIVI